MIGLCALTFFSMGSIDARLDVSTVMSAFAGVLIARATGSGLSVLSTLSQAEQNSRTVLRSLSENLQDQIIRGNQNYCSYRFIPGHIQKGTGGSPILD
jgi:hypothetical protein